MLEVVLAGLLGAMSGYGYCAYRYYKRTEADYTQLVCAAWTGQAEREAQPVCLHVGEPISGSRIRVASPTSPRSGRSGVIGEQE